MQKINNKHEKAKTPQNLTAVGTHLPSREVFGFLIKLVNMGGEGLEVGDDELLAEGLSEQDNVALDTPDEQNQTAC